MKDITTLVARLVLVLAFAAIVAPGALAKGGATVRTYAPPPLDAGSAAPNPDYDRISPYARVSRGAVRPDVRDTSIAAQSSGDGFDWRDAGIGAGAALVLALCIAPLLLVRQAGQKSLART